MRWIYLSLSRITTITFNRRVRQLLLMWLFSFSTTSGSPESERRPSPSPGTYLSSTTGPRPGRRPVYTGIARPKSRRHTLRTNAPRLNSSAARRERAWRGSLAVGSDGAGNARLESGRRNPVGSHETTWPPPFSATTADRSRSQSVARRRALSVVSASSVFVLFCFVFILLSITITIFFPISFTRVRCAVCRRENRRIRFSRQRKNVGRSRDSRFRRVPAARTTTTTAPRGDFNGRKRPRNGAFSAPPTVTSSTTDGANGPVAAMKTAKWVSAIVLAALCTTGERRRVVVIIVFLTRCRTPTTRNAFWAPN